MTRPIIEKPAGGIDFDESGDDTVIALDMENLNAATTPIDPANVNLIVEQTSIEKTIPARDVLDVAPLAMMFGDGSDGDLVTTGDVSITSDKYYDNLTVSDGNTLSANGFKIFVKDTLANESNGVIEYNGAPGVSGEAGSGGSGGSGSATGGIENLTANPSLTDNLAGSDGGDGGDSQSAGSQGNSGNALVIGVKEATIGSVGGAGGAGEGGSGGAGDAGGAAGSITLTLPSSPHDTSTLLMWRLWNVNATPDAYSSFRLSAGSSGGGGGGGGMNGTGTGGGGGGGGGGGATGGSLLIVARHIVNNGQIQVNGGAGGSGGTGEDGSGGTAEDGGGGGGGAGGNGGIVGVICQTYSGGDPEAEGGAGGAGGSSVGGTAGAAGSNGTSGLVVVLKGRE